MKIKNNINWNCEVFYLFNKNNLGCKKAVSSAIDWFFNNEESGIILEDDCLPSKSFFKFCELMLVKYKNDTRIFHIDGTNFCESSSHYMYEFSKYALIWGWASWKRAWLKYDLTMNDFPEFKRKNSLNVVFNKKIELKYWYKMLSNAYENKIDTWDYQWFYTIWKNGGLTIRPHINLIKNIGFDENATHTKISNKVFNKMKALELNFSLPEPKFIIQNKILDEKTSKIRFNLGKSVIKRFIEKFF